MKDNKEVVIFDFCETLVNFQTADAFVDYVRERLNDKKINRRNEHAVRLRKTGIVDYLDFFTRRRFSLPKRLKLLQIEGLDEQLLQRLAEDYYKEIVRNNLIPITMNLLKKYKADGIDVWIISGGYSIYLKPFVDEFKIDKLIASKIQLKNGRATGRMEGYDCMNECKVKLFRAQLAPNTDYKILASFSDSKSDIPILSVAEEAYVISKTHQSWVDHFRFNEIIWGEE